jgi:hypothetical protein
MIKLLPSQDSDREAGGEQTLRRPRFTDVQAGRRGRLHLVAGHSSRTC